MTPTTSATQLQLGNKIQSQLLLDEAFILVECDNGWHDVDDDRQEQAMLRFHKQSEFIFMLSKSDDNRYYDMILKTSLCHIIIEI